MLRSSHYFVASKPEEGGPRAGWKHTEVSGRSTITFPSESGYSHTRAATAYPAKQLKWDLPLKVMRKWMSWRWNSYNPAFPISWLSSAVSRGSHQLQAVGEATGGGTGYGGLTGIILGLWSLSFSYLSAVLSSSILCRLFLLHFHLSATLSTTGKYLIPKSPSPSYHFLRAHPPALLWKPTDFSKSFINPRREQTV